MHDDPECCFRSSLTEENDAILSVFGVWLGTKDWCCVALQEVLALQDLYRPHLSTWPTSLIL